MEENKGFIPSEIDKEILNNVTIAPYMGEMYVRFQPDDYTTHNLLTKRLKQLRLTSANKYFQLLGFAGLKHGKIFDDNQIKSRLKECEDKNHIGFIPRDGVDPYLRSRASKEGIRLEEFLKFFHYELETEEIAVSLNNATEKYQHEILDNLHVKKDKYILDSTSTVYGKLFEFTHNRKTKFELYLKLLIKYWKYNHTFIEPLPEGIVRNIKKSKVFTENSLNVEDYPEMFIEGLLDSDYEEAKYAFSDKFAKYRENCYRKIMALKRIYKGHCQLCGDIPSIAFGRDITEAHHIEPFSKNCNNNFDNIIILCPNHHRVLHKFKAIISCDKKHFLLENGESIDIRLDHHLRKNY